jgi:hypothetical protein
VRSSAVGLRTKTATLGITTLKKAGNNISTSVDHVDCQLMALPCFLGPRLGEIAVAWSHFETMQVLIRCAIDKLGQVDAPKTGVDCVAAADQSSARAFRNHTHVHY